MQPLSATQLLSIARQHFSAGRIAECEGLCRRVLSASRDPAAAALLARVMNARGQMEAGIAYLKQALSAGADAAPPARVEWLTDLGGMLLRQEKWEEAGTHFQQALELSPQDLAALLGWGRALLEQGDLSAAVGAFLHARKMAPQSVEALCWLAEAFRRAGNAAAAITLCRHAISSGEGSAEVHMRLGQALADAEKKAEALIALRQAVALAPQNAAAAGALGHALRQFGEIDEAIGFLRKAAMLDPDARRFVHLGNALLLAGDDEAATAAFGEAIARKPADVQLLSEIGGGSRRQSGLEWLIAACRRELKHDPTSAAAWFGLGVGLQGKRQTDAAVDAYRRTLEYDPGHTSAMNNLAMMIKDQGDIGPAIDLLRRSADMQQNAVSLSNYLYALHFSPRLDPALLAAEHRRWDEQFGTLPLRAARPHDHAPDPDKRLRVGYVSPNFCEHPVGRFLLGFFPALDHAGFETFCYSSVRSPDGFTERIRACADGWLDCRRMSDAALAARIREDQIDILVDLTMHMGQNRLLVFARKPAPVQMSYLAYCSTTGLCAMDYRLTDPYLDPPAASVGDASAAVAFPELPLHLPETYWCYEPGVAVSPDPGPLPALACGHITFASFNNFCKISPQTRAAWARILAAVPRSRLLVHAYAGVHREKFLRDFAARGIAAERLEFFDFLDLPDYLALHRRVDLALDTFPYPGGTTTCDALWMGVPVVSLAGNAPFTRAGMSILSNVGLPELVAATEDQYIQIALQLASDPARLAELRNSLRGRMCNSPLMNASRFAASLEACYRTAWRKWCLDRPHQSSGTTGPH